MDEQYRHRLEQDALAGNKIAERLLLLTLVATADNSMVNDFLDTLQQHKGELERRFLESELVCFHAYPSQLCWHQALRECAEEGHAEATFISNVYHDWAGKREEGGELSWQDGWHDWKAPVWLNLVDSKGLKVDRSAPFAPVAFLAALRSMLAPGLRQSSVMDPDSGQAIAHPVRINHCVQWFPEQLGWLGKLFECRMAAAADYPVEQGEVCTLLSYRKGDRYRPHIDCLNPQQAQSPEGMAEGGQRIMTVLLAMGDDSFAGGETFFPEIDKGTRISNGELLRFNNVDSEGRPLRSSLHEGKEVQSGEKWIMSKWVREATTSYGKEVQLQWLG